MGLKPVDADRLSFNYLSKVDRDAVSGINATVIHETITQYSIRLGPYLLCTFLVAIILVLVYRKIRTYLMLRQLRRFTTSLWLEFNDGSRSILLFVQDVHGLPSDLEASARDYLEHITIQGCIKPCVMLNWTSLQITNSCTGCRIQIKDMVIINWLTAYKLRKLITRPYVCLPVLYYAGKFARLAVHKHASTGGNSITFPTHALYPTAPMLA